MHVLCVIQAYSIFFDFEVGTTYYVQQSYFIYLSYIAPGIAIAYKIAIVVEMEMEIMENYLVLRSTIYSYSYA